MYYENIYLSLAPLLTRLAEDGESGAEVLDVVGALVRVGDLEVDGAAQQDLDVVLGDLRVCLRLHR